MESHINTNMTVNIKNQKEENRTLLTKSLGLPKNTRAIILSFVEDDELRAFLRDACSALGVVFLTSKDDLALHGADAFITDGFHTDLPLPELMKHIVVPIVPKDAKHEKSFKEFNPMKFEGNAFIFDEVNTFLVFEKLVRYLENIRYSGDKRTLLQNVEKTTL